MKELKRTKFVGFRVTADEYTKIENAAFASGHDPMTGAGMPLSVVPITC
jgi:hypothetical protein